MKTIRINEVELTTQEEWLVRNALRCYADRCAEIAAAERVEAGKHEDAALRHSSEHPVGAAEQCRRMARGWDDTRRRVNELEAKIEGEA